MKHKPLTLSLRFRIRLLYFMWFAFAGAFLVYTFGIDSQLNSMYQQIINQDVKIQHLYRQLDGVYSGLSLEDKLLDAMEVVESGGNPNAYNKSSGAIGRLQLTPVVYSDICNMTKDDAFHPEKNRACAKIYLIHLLNKYKGNVSAAVRHYNQGYMKVETKYVSKVMRVLASNP